MTNYKDPNYLKQELLSRLRTQFNVTPSEASDKQVYQALSAMIVEILREKRQSFINKCHSNDRKQIYYLSMEFLMGRSLKTSLYNLELVEDISKILGEYDINLDKIYEYEPDAGLGNGGLGKLAACYMDALATQAYPASSSSTWKTAGRPSCRTTGCPAAPYGWIPGRSFPSMYTSRGIYRNTGISSTTTFPM